jgi:hypothetical protein
MVGGVLCDGISLILERILLILRRHSQVLCRRNMNIVVHRGLLLSTSTELEKTLGDKLRLWLGCHIRLR